MEAKELRVGNLIKDRGGKILRIDWFECNKVCQKITIENIEVHPLTESFEFIQPIPLTEEWLLKFGFEFCDSPEEQGYKFGKYRMFQNSILEFNFCLMEFGDWYQRIESVHQLQNLFYALTGEELKPL